MDKLKFLESNLDRQLVWIQAADSRIFLVLPISTAMLGLLAALLPELASLNTIQAIFVSFAAFFLILSIVFAACASFPRTEGPKGSVVYFSGINDKELDQFRTAIDALDEESLISDVTAQVHVNAQIASKKFSWVRKSVGCLFASLLPWATALLMIYTAN
jgi:hypothetical protein